jgi:hypothetical protein
MVIRRKDDLPHQPVRPQLTEPAGNGQAVLARAALKIQSAICLSRLKLPDRLRPVIVPHGQSPPFVLMANLMGAPGGWRADGNQRSAVWVAQRAASVHPDLAGPLPVSHRHRTGGSL